VGIITVLPNPEHLLKTSNRKGHFQSTQSIEVVLFPAEPTPAGGKSELKRCIANPLGSRLLPYPTRLTRAVSTAGSPIWKTVLTMLTGFFHLSPGPKPSKGSGLWARDCPFYN